jgi:hypothetical protein
VEFARLAVQLDDFEIRVTGDQQEIGAGLVGGGAGEEVEQWVGFEFMVALVEYQRDGSGGFGEEINTYRTYWMPTPSTNLWLNT